MLHLLIKARLFLFGILIIFLSGFILFIPFSIQLNNQFVDNLHGSIPPRDEIVIIGIDDASLGEIGPWPWERDLFAQAVTNLNYLEPKVAAFDILYLEEKPGDDAFLESMIEASYPIILGSKIQDGILQKSHLKADNIYNGYTNFVRDGDGIIRRTTIATELNGECQYSFSFLTISKFVSNKDVNDCDDKITLNERLSYPSELIFNFTESDYNFINITDLLNGSVEKELVEGKIVLIGVLPIDLIDNYTDVFGQTTPGVIFHANIINSFLDGRFQADVSFWMFTLIMLIISSILLGIYSMFKNSIFEFIIYIGSIVIVLFVGIILFDSGINWPFLQSFGILTIGYVYYIVYKYWVESKDKRFLKRAFSHYINPNLINKLIKNPEKLKLGGEKKEITVLFCDLRGFTSISEQLNTAELVKLTNDFFDIETKVILNKKGTIDKYIGDGIMAFWNAPLDDPKHNENAVVAALEMQKVLKQYNIDNPNLPEIRMGIGINTDIMIVGNIGSVVRFNYTLIGDGVNLGSRVEGLTKKYGVEILITESVIKDIDFENAGFLIRIIDEVKVKGKDTSVKIFEVFPKNENNQNVKNIYEDAFAKYQAGDFDSAELKFKELHEDKPSQLLLERIPEVRTYTEWKGVWEWESK